MRRGRFYGFGVFMALAVSGLIAGYVLTSPGEITAAPTKGVVLPSYVQQLEAQAARTGRQVVWTGPGIDFGDGAILFDSVPILMDIEDVGKIPAHIKNQNTQRELQAARMRFNQDISQVGAERYSSSSLARFYLGVKDAAQNGNLRHLSVDDQQAVLTAALRARDDRNDLVNSFVESQNLPKVPGTDCDYGTVCNGCYTKTGEFYGITFCEAACISCVP